MFTVFAGSEFLDPLKQAVSDTVFKKFENAPVFADQNYHDDNSWPRIKRHSISFTDYRRAKTYSDKNRLQSIENVEKERLMALYDVPPRRIRKVESEPKTRDPSGGVKQDQNIRSFDLNFNALRNYSGQSAQGHENYLNWTGEFNNNVMSYQVPMTSTCNNQSETRTTTTTQSDSTSSLGSIQSLHSLNQHQQPSCMPISASAPALCGYGNQSFTNNYKDISQSVPGQIAEELDPHRDEVMRSLDQSEQDLEKEMSLLDEMLQVIDQMQPYTI